MYVNCFGILVVFTFACFSITTTTAATNTSVVGNLIFSSCTTPPSLPPLAPQLPNLSFAKSTYAAVAPYSCNETGLYMGPVPPLTWYYYSSYPPPSGCCSDSSCHTTAISTLNANASTGAFVGSDLVVTTTGYVTSGPYNGNFFTWKIITPIANQAACTTPPGQEIATGSTTMVIQAGPSCTGVYIIEYCPGLRFESTG